MTIIPYRVTVGVPAIYHLIGLHNVSDAGHDNFIGLMYSSHQPLLPLSNDKTLK